jgi:iron-sulfur cluster repair protein YtfE (RIC family)
MAVGMALLALVACSKGGKYGEARELMSQQVSLMENYVSAMEKASSAAEVAAAITRYAESSRELLPKMQALAEKYPDLKGEREAPAELKPLTDKLRELGTRMAQAAMKNVQFMSDPAVQEANRKLAESFTTGK